MQLSAIEFFIPIGMTKDLKIPNRVINAVRCLSIVPDNGIYLYLKTPNYLTASVAPFGSLGIRDSMAVFQCAMNEVLHQRLAPIALSKYINDVMVGVDSQNEVLSLLQRYSLSFLYGNGFL